MGNDGGSIPTRRELVKEAARERTATEVKETQHERQEYHWSTDPLSRRPLARPIVSDSSGTLYNKDSILEFLLPSEDLDAKAEAERILNGAIKSLKDVVEVRFEVDAGDGAGGRGNGAVGKERWICLVTNKRLGPGSKAVYLVPCGHAFSDAAIKEVADGRCIQCDQVYAPNDVIPILPTAEEDIARLSLRVKTLKESGLSHSLKPIQGSKKRKKHQDGEAADKKEKKKEKKKENGSTNVNDSGIKNAATASLTSKILEEQKQRNKMRKLNRNENLDELFTSKDLKPKTNSDFMNRGFTIPANAKH